MTTSPSKTPKPSKWRKAAEDLITARDPFFCFKPAEKRAIREALPGITSEATFRAAMPRAAVDGVALDFLCDAVRKPARRR